MAAVTAIDVGGHPVFLGGDLPVADLAGAVASLGAAAVAVGLCQRHGSDAADALRELRGALPDAVELWVGGPGADAVALPTGAARIADLDDLERKGSLLAERGAGP